MRRQSEYVQYESAPGDPHRPSAEPLYQTATFRLRDGAEFDYSRSGNPTRSVIEKQLATIERGTAGFAFSSGMAALDAVCSLVSAGEEIVACVDLYGGTYRLLSQVVARRGVRVRFVNTSDDAVLVKALERAPQLVLVETPTNPFQSVTDLYRLSELARARGSLVAVDNSLMSPYLQTPLQCGAHLVIHSATKFLNGHSDVTAGAVVTSDAELAEKLRFHQNATGTAVETGSLERSLALVEEVKLFAVTVSFGGVRSTLSLPARMSHASIPEEVRSRRQFPEDLVRLSIGIEHLEDLRDDLSYALDRALAASGVLV